MSRSSRRDFLQRGLAGSALPFVAGPGPGVSGADRRRPRPGPEPDRPVKTRPLDAETPVEVFDRWQTPNRLFFVRSHFEPAGAWGSSPLERLEVDGLVERPASLSLDDLEGLGAGHACRRSSSARATAGGSSGRRSPASAGSGAPWATPSGRACGWSTSWPGPASSPTPRTSSSTAPASSPRPRRSPRIRRPSSGAIPLARALDPSTILATRMNGEALPLLHGGPIRLVVPTWAGNHWIKWLTTITLAPDEATGYFMQNDYRIPRTFRPPGSEIKPADEDPVTALNVKSLITRPLEAATLKAGRVEVQGFAWTGEGVVTRVEVQTAPDGPWATASSRANRSPGPGSPGPSPGTPDPAARPSAPGPPTRPAPSSPRPPPGTTAATSGTASTASPARSVDRWEIPPRKRPDRRSPVACSA